MSTDISNENEENEEKPEIFKSLIKVQKDDLVFRPNCRLCNHELRFGAEQFWLDNGCNFTKTTEWLNECLVKINALKVDSTEAERDFNVRGVRNHLKTHFMDQERQIRLKEYAKDLEGLIQHKQDREVLLEVSLAACKENLSRVATTETFGDPELEFKRSGAINKVIAQMVSVMNEQAKMEGELGAIELVQEKFVQVWIDFIGKESNDAKKKVLVQVLEEFSGKFKEGELFNE